MSDNSAPTRDLHPHYCNICEGDWEHDDVCQEGAVACCPWCFPIADAPPAPGARRGPHFHFCPECTQNWQHQDSCSEPLRAALPDCTGCREQSSGRAIAVLPSRPHVSAHDFLRRARLLRKVGAPAAIAAGVIIAIPLLLLVPSRFSGRQPQSVARIPEPPPVAIPPAAQPPAPPPAAPQPSASQPAAPPPVTPQPAAPQPVTPQSVTPQPAISQPPARAAEERPSTAAQVRAQREGERHQARPAPAAPQLPARSAPPREPMVAAKPPAPANPPGPPGLEEARVAPAPPPPPPTTPAPPREAVVESVPRTPEAPTPPSESRTAGAGPVIGAVPGALSQGGGAALDTLLPGPRRFAHASRPRQDQVDWSSESPRWDRTAISVLMRAVVDIRPSQRRDTRPPIRGFVVDELGHVLTSDQRLGDATVLEVALSDGRTLAATVVLRDRLNHIAVLRLARRGAPMIRLGDSASLAVGERVLVISSNTGSDRAPAAATVLATGAGTGGNLAIDLTPAPDGAGGPLLNHSGAAIGILIDGAPFGGAPRKLSFAVPIDRIKALLRDARPRSLADLLPAPEGR